MGMPPDRRLVGKTDTGRLGGTGEGCSVLGDKRLVGGDYVPAGENGRLTDLLGDAIGAADQFDHHLGVGLGGHNHRIIVPGKAVDRHGAPLVPCACRYGAHHDLSPAQTFEGTGVCLKHLEGTGPNCA